MSEKALRVVATGDMFITRRIAEDGYEGFEELSDCIKEHDVKFSNLEMTFHNQEGYPAAVSGGTWAMMEPEALDDVKRFGFNLYNTANNHSGDYGQEGVLATIRHLKERDMVFSGTGRNLAEASKACYLETRKARVALISVSSSFHEAARAGGQSHELVGRPGLNPLRFQTRYHVDQAHYEMAQELVRVTKVNAEKEFSIKNGYSNPFEEGTLPFGSAGTFCLDDKNWIESVPNAEDMKRITDEIKEARKQAEAIVADAKAEADRLRGDARAEIEVFKSSAQLNAEQARRDAVLAFRQEIQKDFEKLLAADVGKALDQHTLAKLIQAAVQGEDVSAYTAEVGQVTEGLRQELAQELKAGLEIRPSKKVGAGFRLAAKDGSGYFDCSEQEIANMLTPFFRDMRL